MLSWKVKHYVFIVLGLFLMVRSASAQSSIAGLVRDESGGVLPGVTVEASSPVLIEKVRSVVTDDQGRYRFVDMRPGAYQITYSLPGFATVVRNGVELAANVVTNVNIDLSVAGLSETVVVTSGAPLIDVQQASKTQTLTRDIIDSLPTTRNIMSLGIMVPGVRFQTPDVGGSRAMEQPFLRVHGVNYFQQVQMVDGMWIQSNEDILSLSYFDDGMQSEVSMTTSALPAENPGSGARMNSILKDGGNIFSGAVFAGGTNGAWQSKNVDDYLRSRAVKSANGIAHIKNYNVSAGGPIVKNKLWYYAAGRAMSTNETVANVEKEFVSVDGERIEGILPQYVNDIAARLTYQMSQNNKLGVFFERIYKYKGKDFGYGTDSARVGAARPEARALRHRHGQVYLHAHPRVAAGGRVLDVLSALHGLHPARSELLRRALFGQLVQVCADHRYGVEHQSRLRVCHRLHVVDVVQQRPHGGDAQGPPGLPLVRDRHAQL